MPDLHIRFDDETLPVQHLGQDYLRSADVTGREGLVIVGAGQAGFQLAASARSAGYTQPITLLGEEQVAPYQRPPLSKAYLLGKTPRESLMLQSASYFDEQAIELQLGTKAVAIHRAESELELSSGACLPYKHLVLATGASSRMLQVPGARLKGVMALRHLADADAIKEQLETARRIVIVGGGLIGLEVAAVATSLRKQVTVVETQPRLMQRAVTDKTSEFFAEEHRRQGVTIHVSSTVSHFEGAQGAVREVCLADGRKLPCDMVLVGIGVTPNDELATAAGLPADKGILVDRELRTNDEHIFAIGDCAAFEGPGRSILRIESIQNAIDQARHVAGTLTGVRRPYDAVPWFWSEQYGCKLQMAGITSGADTTVLQGDVRECSFSVFAFRNDQLIGADSINRQRDHVHVRKILASGRLVTPDEIVSQGGNIRSIGKKAPVVA